jgi:hypothetical protein
VPITAAACSLLKYRDTMSPMTGQGRSLSQQIENFAIISHPVAWDQLLTLEVCRAVGTLDDQITLEGIDDQIRSNLATPSSIVASAWPVGACGQALGGLCQWWTLARVVETSSVSGGPERPYPASPAQWDLPSGTTNLVVTICSSLGTIFCAQNELELDLLRVLSRSLGGKAGRGKNAGCLTARWCARA